MFYEQSSRFASWVSCCGADLDCLGCGRASQTALSGFDCPLFMGLRGVTYGGRAAGSSFGFEWRLSAASGTMLLKVGGAGLDDAGGALPRVACSTGSKPGLMHGGTGIRTRGPGTAAGLRFSSFHRIDTTRRLAGYKTSRENLPKLAFPSSGGGFG